MMNSDFEKCINNRNTANRNIYEGGIDEADDNCIREAGTDRVCELECNIDDMTAEELAFAAEQVMAGGARDVTLTPITMKKGRPATMLTVMCRDDASEKEKMIGLIFRYTTTIGIREVISQRYILDRAESVIVTPYGDVRCKTVSGYGVTRYKLEYEDLARIARERGIGIPEARKLVEEFRIEED